MNAIDNAQALLRSHAAASNPCKLALNTFLEAAPNNPQAIIRSQAGSPSPISEKSITAPSRW